MAAELEPAPSEAGRAPPSPRLGRLERLAVASLLLVLLGQYGELFAYLLLFLVPVFLFLPLLSLIWAGSALVRRSWLEALRGLITTFAWLVAFGLTSRIIIGTPSWVVDRARPFIEELERHREAHGRYPEGSSLLNPEFPETLKARARAARCTYGEKEDGRSFRLICDGVLFTKCSYDHRKGTWSGWD